MRNIIGISDILNMDATSLAEKIKNKKVRSADATAIYVDHLRTINKEINCVVADRFDEALAEAQACDHLIDSNQADGRLFGPISVKESFHVKGMKTTGGFKHRAYDNEKADSDVVLKLKREGAIILCKTNTSTADLTFESNNKLFGRTNNPWDKSATAGGSSGGEAAAIACGGATVGVGSDLAGSLRLPAHFNGVITFKAGADHVSLNGHFPRPIHILQEKMLGIGVLSKSIADAERIHSILSNITPEEVDLEKFRLIIPDIPSGYRLSQDTEKVLHRVRRFFAENSDIESGKMPGFIAKLPLVHLKVLAINGAKELYPAFFKKEKFPIAKTMLRELIQKDTSYYYYFLKTLLLAKVGSKIFRARNDKIEKLQAKVTQLIEHGDSLLDKGILVLPVYSTPAKKHGQFDKALFSNRFLYPKLMPYTILPNVLGYPALTVPIAKSEQGLPISVQLISRVGNEKALFYFGRQLEREFLGYQRALL